MRIALGTVQFGLNYGIRNTFGQTPYDEVARILTLARNSGINTLDTATAYGESERVLGDLGIAGWNVVTKLPSFINGIEDERGWVLTHVRNSLASLRVNRLEALLVHNSNDLLGVHGLGIVNGLIQAKAEGLVEKVGYSIYSPQLLVELTRVLQPELVQAPLNVLDQRLVRSGWLNKLVDLGTEIHVRSAFLQGLLLMNSEERPPIFDKWSKLMHQWDSVNGSCPEQALKHCLGFIKGLTGISHIVVGVETQSHLQQLLTIWEKTESFDASSFACDDEELLEPRNWKV